MRDDAQLARDESAQGQDGEEADDDRDDDRAYNVAHGRSDRASGGTASRHSRYVGALRP